MRAQLGAGLPRVSSTFSPTERARAALGGLPSVVVLRAPRGHGKSSTVAHWLRRTDLPDHDVAWLTLPRTAGRDELWRALGAAARRAGLTPGEDGRGWDDVARAARRRRRRVVLVVDGLDRVRDEDVDEELVGLVQEHEELHLVLLMRTQRPVEALARVALDTVVLQREDLALDAAHVTELARAAGRPVSPAEARRLSEELGGWPGLVRAALLTAGRGDGGELVLDAASLADYLRLVLQDAELAEIAPHLAALAVPDRVTDDVAAALLGRDGRAAVLQRARAAGLVNQHGGALVYPAIVRQLLRRVLREDAPDRYRALNEAMVEHHRREGDAVGALRHAVRAENPSVVLDVVEEAWDRLLRAPGAFRDALSRVPADALGASAKGVVAREHVRPATVADSFQLALVSGLRPGVGWEGAPASHFDGQMAPLLVEVGTRALLDGELLRAAHAFADAVVQAEGGEAGEGRAGAALSLALLGHTGAARRYLEATGGPDGPGAPGGTDGGPLARVAGALVPALLELDRLAPVDLAADLDVPAELAGLGAVGLYVRAGAALLRGAGNEMTGELERFRHGPAGDVPLAEGLLVAALVDLYLAAGRGDRVRHLLAGLPAGRRDGWTRTARARGAVYAGEHDLALQVTAGAVELAALRPRTALKLSLARAVAAHRTGRRHVATEALELASSLAGGTGIVRPFAMVPRGDLEQVAAVAPAARAVLDRPELAVSAEPLPPPASVRLSRSELRVLGELATGRPVTHVARRLFVSESTVKTQVRSIYRKLDVHTRADAIARARVLGILPPQ
ncbi:LuxR C-terminal-related transcriptional regulator [Georgenia sp. AZ-5]|uniref:LuxR C-terminal-related transcriptional regulator n=1 Tax=Georgenia sp. AZ-5 TaxID=3367526 RepID=UPI00375512AE